ncbi:SHOCT domain-containing protein [Yinghuangia sp. YIM S09857]|uniref:SHOCT domain-containing protein n=1 Tax=Yinghuangia sp. YIM S09857 TaxID=3436929 RepID=UPI003F52FA3A
MIWSDHNLGGWGWFGMTASMVVIWALVITMVVWLTRTLSDRDHPRRVAPPPHRQTPEQLLAERFARGEINEDEYLRRLAVLRRPPPPKGADPHAHGHPST